MEDLLSKIDQDFKQALKNKEGLLISTLRLLKNAIHNLEIEKRGELSQEDLWQLINKEIKQRKEAVTEYRRGKRKDLVKKEEKEIEILERFLPEQLSDKEINKVVKEAILKTKASSQADLGKVMKKVMAKIKGKAEGFRVALIAKEELKKG